MNLSEITKLVDRVSIEFFGHHLNVLVRTDQIEHNSRVYIQLEYKSPCAKTGKMEVWRGRKWYLSPYMIPDEIIKTVYAAFELAVKHEIMESFKVDGKALFNPHTDFEQLLTISDKEVKR